MKRITLNSLLVLFSCMVTTFASGQKSKTAASADSTRIAELNQFWTKVSRTVQEGDFHGYSATYHKDAVCVIASIKNKYTAPIDVQLDIWKQGFADTKAGKTKDKVEFRFSQRLGDATTAHETGIFYFTSVDSNGKVLVKNWVIFEDLLVKRNGAWVTLMEYQKSKTTQEVWDDLKVSQ